MKAADSPESAGRSILDRLGIAEDPLTSADPVSFLRSLTAAGVALMKNPVGVAAANARLAIGTAAAIRATAERALGGQTPGPMNPVNGDKRFADPAYTDNPLYFLLAQQYLLGNQLVTELLDAAGLEEKQDSKARFAAKFVVDALAPTNTLPGNPAAISRAVQTRGRSLVTGARNFVHDARHNNGMPSTVDRRPS